MTDRHVTWAPLPTESKRSQTALDVPYKPVRFTASRFQAGNNVKQPTVEAKANLTRFRTLCSSTDLHGSLSRYDSLLAGHDPSNEEHPLTIVSTDSAIKRHGAVRRKFVPGAEMQDPTVLLPANGTLRRRGAVRYRKVPTITVRQSSPCSSTHVSAVRPIQLHPERFNCLVKHRDTNQLSDCVIDVSWAPNDGQLDTRHFQDFVDLSLCAAGYTLIAKYPVHIAEPD